MPLPALLASSKCVRPRNCKTKVSKDECVIEPVWLHAQEETPPLLTDAAFGSERDGERH